MKTAKTTLPQLLMAAVVSALMFSNVITSRAVLADTSTVAAPSNLTMLHSGTDRGVAGGTWISSGKIDLSLNVAPVRGRVNVEFEVRPSAVAFSGHATSVTSTTGSRVRETIGGLINGATYHWQARVSTSDGRYSSWVPFDAVHDLTMDFGVDQTPPSRPELASSTNPNQRAWYHTRTEQITWSSQDQYSGVAGYTYRVLHHARVIQPGPASQQSAVNLRALGDGTWYVAVRSVDAAGNWSPTATFRLNLDTQPARFLWMSSSHFIYNPYRGTTSVRFKLSETARLKLQLFRVGSNSPIRTYYFSKVPGLRLTSLSWNGRNQDGTLAKEGYYYFHVTLVDRANNTGRWNFGGIRLHPEKAMRSVSGQLLYPNDGKRIIVSISRETLYAYNGVHLDLSTYVTTGNPNLPTPLGDYRILARYHPYEFVSPWPLGSPFWYASSRSQYAMLFREGGYFLHDAPWRSAFGPGTNRAGQPGTNYGGTHGCVNIPPGPTFFLWNWASIGTPVQVVP